MTEPKETKDSRELIAEDINSFIRSAGLPTVLDVKAEDLTLTEDGTVRVSRKIGDVNVSVEIGKQSLMHLAVIRGLVGVGKNILGRS